MACRSGSDVVRLNIENLPAAECLKTLLQDWLHTHIDNLSGVQPATLARYRTYVIRGIEPIF